MVFEDIRRQVAALDLGAPVSIRVSARARRIGLRIDAAERRVELVLPRGVTASQGLRFLVAKREWVATRFRTLHPPLPFVEGAIVPVFGIPHRIRREFDAGAPPVAIVDGENPSARRTRASGAPSPRPSCCDGAQGVCPSGSSACLSDREERGAGQRARYEEPMGELLGASQPFLQLAIDLCARVGRRLCRRTRGCASR